jgi:hypothetical protein
MAERSQSRWYLLGARDRGIARSSSTRQGSASRAAVASTGEMRRLTSVRQRRRSGYQPGGLRELSHRYAKGRHLAIPPECEGFADQIQQLEDSKRDIGDVPYKDKAAAINKNLQIQEQIVQLQEKLHHCIVAFGGAYSTDVVIFDVGGGPVTFPLEATLSGFGIGSPIERSPVSGGRLTFNHDPPPPLAASFSVSIDEATNPSFSGPLFRSNPLQSLPPGSPGNPTGAITIVIPATVFIPAPVLAAAPVPLPGIAGFKVTSAITTLGVGVITVVLTGLVLTWLPVTFTYVFGLTPSRDMSAPATTIVDVVPVSGTLSVGGLGLGGATGSVSGAFTGLVFSAVIRAVGPLISAAITPAVSTAINKMIVAAAATALGAPLTPFQTISMRKVAITPSAIGFSPALGTFGP